VGIVACRRHSCRRYAEAYTTPPAMARRAKTWSTVATVYE